MRRVLGLVLVLLSACGVAACGDIVLPGGSDTGGGTSDDVPATVSGDVNAGGDATPPRTCTFGEDGGCDDDDSCTVDQCNAKGECVHTGVTGGCKIDGACYVDGAASSLTVCKICSPALSATQWSDLSCDDGKSCTKNLCDSSTGCTSAPDDTALCDDGLACSTDDHCQAGQCVATPCACNADVDCGAPGVCRKNRCAQNVCVSEPDAAQAGAVCDDGDACTTGDACVSGSCAGTPISCADLDGPCTKGQCQDGGCVTNQAPDGAACTAACLADATCTEAGNCEGSWDVDACGCDDASHCDDGLACTTDTCNEVAECVHELLAGNCLLLGKCFAEGEAAPSDACAVCDPLAFPESRAPSLTGAFVPRACADDDLCTADGCVAESGCVSTPIAGCCTGPDDCADTVVGPCQRATCSNNLCEVEPADDGGSCDDGDTCTSGDQCASGACVGVPKDCTASEDACHSAACVAGDCVVTITVAAACDDGNACTAQDQCASDGACAGVYACACQTDLDCADKADACHDAVCGESGGCELTPRVGVACDDGEACTTSDVCDGVGACHGQQYACQGLTCEAASCDGQGGCAYTPKPGSCVIAGACWPEGSASPNSACLVCAPAINAGGWSPREDGAGCDADQSGCTQGDVCVAGACVVGSPVLCDDGLVCTSSVCSPISATDYTCQASANGDGCWIGGACVAAGAGKSGDACLVCAPELSRTAWSPRANGTACDADGNSCTNADACSAGVCVAGAPVVCDDGKACTVDHCVSTGASSYDCVSDLDPAACLIAGACRAAGDVNADAMCQVCAPGKSQSAWSAAADGLGCDADHSGCTAGDACSAGQCVPGAPVACNDALACTQDTCVATGATTYTCESTVATGCLIAGACVAGDAAQPGNPCQVCNPAALKTGWSAAVNGVACDADQSGCTAGDACAQGTCKAGPAVSCDDQNSCTADQCVSTGASTYTCKNTATASSCQIEGACIADGTRNPTNPCLICDPARSTTAWSQRPDGSACDADQNGCTVGDQCLSGQCKTGNAPACADALACTADACASTGSDSYTCTHLGNGQGCFIGGACVAEGTPEPGNPCRWCAASNNPSGWSARASGTACGDTATACRNADVCDGNGACVDKGFVASGALCGDGATPCSSQDTCDGAGQCQPNHKPTGTACGDADSACVLADSCDGAGACKDAGFRANGTSCNADNNGCTQNDGCQNGVCTPGGAPSCSDGLGCTADACVSTGSNGYLCQFTANGAGCYIGGTCVAEGAANPSSSCLYCTGSAPGDWSKRANGTSCNADSNGCTPDDTCQAGACQAGAAASCNDGLNCTTDACASTGVASYTCSHTANGSACVIDGACVASGTERPGASCQVCMLGNPTTWSPKASGAPCDADGSGCTRNDACSGTGACVAGAPESCDDGLYCTADACVSTSATTSQCTHGPTSLGCAISNTCYGAGATNPNNVCEVCSPGQQPFGWTPKGSESGCEDGDACTQNDTCGGSSCHAGPRLSCDDGLACTTDQCTSAGGQAVCSNSVASGCVIDGVCREAGEVELYNSCQLCEPSSSTTAWTTAWDGSGCTDADCGVCYSGYCYANYHYCSPYYYQYCDYGFEVCGECPAGTYDCGFYYPF